MPEAHILLMVQNFLVAMLLLFVLVIESACGQYACLLAATAAPLFFAATYVHFESNDMARNY